MKLNLLNYFSRTIRFKLAELIVSNRIKGILTTKYPPDILETEFFDEMPKDEKDFLKKYWNTFDIFKPIFEIVNEVPKYKDFILYEVKSKIMTEKNGEQLEIPKIQISLNQKHFFDECTDRHIPIKLFLVFFFKNWDCEYTEFDANKVEIKICYNSVWNEERIKRIKSSKLNQFWHDLFPNRVLYKVDEKELEEEDTKRTEEYLKEMTRTPLRNFEKEMLIKKAKKKGKRIPKFLESIDLGDNLVCESKTDMRTNYHKRLEEIKEKFPKAYEPWEVEEDKKLSELHKEGESTKEISKILKRQPSAIGARLKKLGLLS